MNKIGNIIINILVVILFFAQTAALLYYVSNGQKLRGKVQKMEPDIEKVNRDLTDLQKEYTELTKVNKAMKVDRENLLAQIKTLLSEKNKAVELTASLDKAAADMADMRKTNEELKSIQADLQGKIAEFRKANEELTRERDTLKNTEKNAGNDQMIEDLKSNVAKLQKEKSSLENTVKEAHLKNVQLESEASRIPVNFAEIARQNKSLLRETAEMHYNLGVFYTKGKEYKRAIAEFEKVIDLDPNDSYAHFNLGYIYAEYQINRKSSIEHFRQFLRLAKSNDKDVDWVKKYLLTWETYGGKQQPVE